MQLGIAILVNDDVHNALRRLQLLVAERCGRNPALKQTPHVTIKQPFHVRELAPVEEYFDTLVNSLDAFPVRIRGLGFFEDDSVAYLQVVPDARLEDLRLRVLRDLTERFGVKPRDVEDERYRFHATVAYGLSPDEFLRAREALTDVDIDRELTIETIGLFYYTGEEWIVYKRSAVPGAD